MLITLIFVCFSAVGQRCAHTGQFDSLYLHTSLRNLPAKRPAQTFIPEPIKELRHCRVPSVLSSCRVIARYNGGESVISSQSYQFSHAHDS